MQLRGSSGSETSTHLAGSEEVTVVRRLAKEENSPSLPHLASRISTILKFGAGTGVDPFAKVKGLITELISPVAGGGIVCGQPERSAACSSSVQSCRQ